MEITNSLFSEILAQMQCPHCGSVLLEQRNFGLACKDCHKEYPLINGILDMTASGSKEVITPFQRLMQTPAIVSIYEKIWRRIGYFLASSRSFNKEIQTVLLHGKKRNLGLALDLACGPGVFTRPLALQAKGLVVGLDLSWPMLKQAQRQIQQEGINNIFLIRASAFGLPFQKDSFSYVNCCGALHLFDRPEAALSEIHRILHPDGSFCAQTTIRPNRSGGFAFILERCIRFGFFNEQELVELLNNQGFKISERERHRISFTFLASK
jgi:ubiquinone/menaquinone biosynthesis C-methylase UbiE